jgi:molybdopterin synthase sulfur carrier subunit
MVRIEFLGPINKKDLHLNIDNLNKLSDVLKEDNDLIQWLDICAVAINDILVIDKNTSLKEGDKVSLLPPVCGG